MKETIEISIRNQENVSIIDLSGEITSYAEKKLQEAYDDLRDAGVKNICINFENVSYINSAGMAIIIGILTKVREHHQTLIGFGLSEHFQKIFGMVGITKYMKHFESEESALSEIK